MKSIVILFLFFALANSKEDNCYLEDTDFTGTKANILGRLFEVESWNECGKICGGFNYPEQCNFWTWYHMDNHCYLMSNDDGFFTDLGVISGNKDCP